MSSFDSIYKKIASSLEQGGAGHAHESKVDPSRQIPASVAHELNNILTIIQGYADRLILRHQNDQALEPHLKLISEAARRATIIVRDNRADTPAAPVAASQPDPHQPAPVA
jgi:C4-dicarboxylate-specific signal transduction histidine kinase